VPVLAALPGQTLANLAKRMTREEVPPGTTVLREGDEGDRFYVLLAGIMSVTQSDYGQRALLRPGDYFGEVALTMRVPRTASVRAVTPAVVASCDRETFETFVRPLFADD
jgi:ATP-binding cassette subfamily B protein